MSPELAAFLRDQDIACLMRGTNQGTVFVIKLPTPDIESTRGTVPIQLQYELYVHRNAPVIRTVLCIYDQPDAPLTLETFTNIADEQQRSDFAALADQDTLLLLFYNERLDYRLTKVIPQSNPEQATFILSRAAQVLAEIPKEQFDFERAKQVVMRATSI